MIRLRQLSIFALLLLSYAAWAIKANPTPTSIRQSDGTTLSVIAHGDADLSWYTTTDGVLLYHEGFNYYIASVDSNGVLSPTPQLAHEIPLRSNTENKLIGLQNRHLFLNSREQQAKKRRIRREPVEESSTLVPHQGNPHFLVILAEFQDSVFKDDNPKEIFEQFLNAETIDKTVGNRTVGVNYGSVRQYFNDMSFGQFQPEFDIYGPVKLSHPLVYYGEGSGDYMSRFIPEVCQLAYEAGVDFSKYDINDDGRVDLVYVIYAGFSESITGNSTDCIWPKTGSQYAGPYNGKNIGQYSVCSELNGFPNAWGDKYYINGIGVFCHEFSHCMGLPDFYPTSTKAQDALNPAMEYWDLMDGGEYVYNGYYPTEYTAWEREAFGWMTIDTLKENGRYTLRSINEPGGKAYRILNENDPTGCEYLLLQNIRQKGWNRRLNGQGMLVMHVDYDPVAFSPWNNSVNNIIGHSRFTIIPADGELINFYAINGETITSDMYKESMAGDPFPGSMNVKSLENVELYSGSFTKQLTNIEETGDGDITFDFYDIYSGIHEIHHDSQTDNLYFHINGQAAGQHRQALRPGLYIRNHKEVVVR